MIEILVSVVIGLLGIVVMFQVLKMWDSLKRTTAAGSDAQIAGTVAMFSLERDIRPAGMGFSKGDKDTPLVPSMGCKVWAKSPTTFSTDMKSPDYFSLVPVRIVPGEPGPDPGERGPDKIITLYGNSSFFVSTQKYKFTTTDSKTVDGSFGGFKRGDVVIAGGNTAATDCELLEVTSDATPGVLGHTESQYRSYYTGGLVDSRFNPAPPKPPGVTLPPTGFLYNLGPSPQRNVWSIQNEKLYRQDSLYAAAATEVADNIIDLRAQYGIDANGNGKIDDDGTNNEWHEADPAVPPDWAKVIAIRVALLSRSQQFEKTEVTPDRPSWAGGVFNVRNIADATVDVANWKHYRYRVYEKVVPLRNMVWGGDFK